MFNKILVSIGLFISSLHYPNIHQIRCIQQTMYYEASPTSVKQAKMVGRVIINRIRSNDFPDTACKVISQPNQFASFQGFNDFPNISDSHVRKVWNRDFILSSFQYVFQDHLDKRYDDLLYFHTSNITTYSDWEYDKIYIGNQVFFRK